MMEAHAQYRLPNSDHTGLAGAGAGKSSVSDLEMYKLMLVYTKSLLSTMVMAPLEVFPGSMTALQAQRSSSESR
jgi:hypothetical protein